AKNTHCPDDRRKVAQFMCHDTATADRFYALNLNAKQAAEHRRLGAGRKYKTGHQARKEKHDAPKEASFNNPLCQPIDLRQLSTCLSFPG
ncbi:hypothetical protein M9458_029517, partial [Cirrhinus mrigala]